jgi:hypothetical protein
MPNTRHAHSQLTLSERPRAARRKSGPALRILAAALLAALAGYAPVSSAQASPPVEIIIPSKLMAGEPATLTVLDAAGHVVPRENITFSDGSHTETDVNGYARMTAPQTPGALIARLTLHRKIAACTVVLPHAVAPKLTVSLYPSVVSIRDPFEIQGEGFSGDAGGDRVAFHDQPALVLAASPAALVIQLDPKSEPGVWTLDTTANGFHVWYGLAAIGIEFTLSSEHLAPGAKSKLTVRVRGTDQPQILEITDLAPDVLQFTKDTGEQLKTRGGVDNSASLDVRALRAGDFSFRVRILSSGETAADIAGARAYLEAAQAMTSPQWKRRLDPVISELERPKAKIPPVLQKLEKMILEAPQGDFEVLLGAARDALRGH